MRGRVAFERRLPRDQAELGALYGTRTGSDGYCWAHDPANAQKRRRMASRAGSSKGGGEIAELKKQLKDLAADVLSGEVGRSEAAVVNQILNACARLIELERKIRDMEEIEEKVDKYGELLPELMGRLERELATEVLAVWDAFSGFCEEEMGLSAEKLLQAIFRPALEDVAWFGDLCERLGLEADRAATEKCWEALAAHWQRIVEQG